MALKLVSRLIMNTLIPILAVTIIMGTAMPIIALAEEFQPIEVGAEDAPSQEGAEVLNDVFGEVILYRWDRVKRSTYPIDTDWHLSMLVWQRGGNIDDGYIAALAPDDIYLGPNSSAVPGVTHRLNKGDAIYDKYFKDHERIEEKRTCYIRLTDRAEGIDIGSDPQVQPSKDVFYTDDDRDCLYVKYDHKDKDNNGADGQQAPVFAIKMSKSKNAPDGFDYVIEPWGDEDDSAISFHAGVYGYEWTFKSYDKGSRGDMWRVFYNKDDERDPTLSVGEGLRFAHTRSEDKDWNLYKWYIATKLRFSSIKSDVTVRGGQLLSISESNYVDTGGNLESQNGVILPSGRTITIEKGGVLSVSGNFINNGTIINNGGTIIVQKGGSIYPFIQGDDSHSLGCGSIKCNSGDIIIEDGGALYTGLNCTSTNGNRDKASFWLDNSSTLVNYGVLGFGQMDLGDSSTVENRSNGRIYSCLWQNSWGTFLYQLSDNNSKLRSGNTSDLKDLGYIYENEDYYGGISIINGPRKLTNVPYVYVTKGKEGYLNNPDRDWNSQYVDQGLIRFGKLEL